ncbi:TetR/AcrR family transcriptional regulator [Streptomyces sp. NPDC054784]
MTAPPAPGRRARKKAATRQKIADTALRLFLARGYEAVGIRDVAAEADVAVTTVFAHFAAKEALVFDQDADFTRRLDEAVAGRAPHEPLVPALHREMKALVLHCTRNGAEPVRRMIDETPALRRYEESMRLRHTEALAAAITGAVDPPRTATACRALARFTIDAHALAREADDPEGAVDEIFRMIDAAWAAGDGQRAD